MTIELVEEGAADVPELEANETETEAVEVSEETTEVTEEGNTEGGEETVENPEAPKTYKIKFGDEEQEVTYEELVNLAEKANGADRKYDEAAATRKNVEALVEKMKSNPFETLEKLGINSREAAEKYVMELLERDALPEDQKQALEKEKQLTEREQAIKDKEEASQKAEVDRLAKQYREDYDRQITDVLKTSTLPKTPETVSRIAGYLIKGREQNYDMTIANAAKLVEEDLVNESKAIYGNTDAEKIVKMLGPELVKKLKDYDLGQIKSPQDKNTITEPVQSKKERKESKKMQWKDFQSTILDAITD